MSMQKRPTNQIEARKLAVRKYAQNGAITVGVSVVAGVALALLTQHWSLLVLGVVIAVVGGGYCWSKIQKITNHKDEY